MMNNDMMTIANAFSVQGSGSEDLRELANKASQHLKKDFPEIQRDMDALVKWKEQYDTGNALERWWDNNILAEKRDEMIVLTMKSAKQQMDVIKFIAWLNAQMLALQKTLNESQNQLKSQNVQLQQQQKVIQEQQQALEEHQKHMDQENQKILEGCDVLRKLRSIVIGHEQTIGTNKNGIDELIVQLSEIYKDVGAFDKDSKKRDSEIAEKFKTYRVSVDKANREAARKTEDVLRRTTALSSEVEAKFDKASAEIAATLRTTQDEIRKNDESVNERLTNRIQDEENALNAHVSEVISGLQEEASKLRTSCQERIDTFEERVSDLAARCERAEINVKRLMMVSIVPAVLTVVTIAVALWALMR